MSTCYLEVAEVAGVQGRIVTHLSQSVDKSWTTSEIVRTKVKKKNATKFFLCVCFLKEDANKKGVVGEPRDSVQQELG